MDEGTDFSRSDWDDYIQPINDHFDNLIGQIQSQGAHAAIAQMQAAGDASGADGGGGSGSFAGSLNIPPLGPSGPQSAAGVEGAISQNPVNLQDAGPPDVARYHAGSAGSTVATAPTLDDAARSAPFNLTDQNLTDISTQTNNRLDDQAAIQGATLSLLGTVIPEEKLPEYAKKIGSAAIDALNGNLDILGEQEKKEAYQQALMKQLNNMAVQQSQSPYVSPLARGFLPN